MRKNVWLKFRNHKEKGRRRSGGKDGSRIEGRFGKRAETIKENKEQKREGKKNKEGGTLVEKIRKAAVAGKVGMET